MSKEYIKDNGKVRKCASNLAKMNMLEWVYYYFKDWNGLGEIKYHFIEDVKNLCIHVIDLLLVVFFPIIIIIKAIVSIYSAKQYENYIRNKETKQHHFRVEISDPNGIRKTPLRAAGDRACVKDGIRIRRLTPKECWKLMGVKDDDFNKLHDISHHQLYKLSGNSIVVNVLMEIFKNLLCK